MERVSRSILLVANFLLHDKKLYRQIVALTPSFTSNSVILNRYYIIGVRVEIYLKNCLYIYLSDWPTIRFANATTLIFVI